MNPISPVANDNLIPVFRGQLGGVPASVVDARALHTFLENQRKFADWIKQRIEQYGFENDQDFALISQNCEAKRGGHNRKDYHLSLDMAKELSMVENNDRGRQARRYFIEMERKALAAAGQAVPLSHVETLTASEQQTLSEIVHARSEAAGENQGKALAEIWSRLHRKFRIARYSQLPRTELADAILYVTGMQLRTSAPKMPELLTNEQRQQLSRIVWLLSSRMTRPEPWRHALWKSFRLLTDCPSPQEFQVSHAPTLVAEAMRILPAIAQIVELRDAMEERALRRLFKDRLEVDEVVHEMRAMVEKEEAEQRDEFQNWLTRWGMRELAPLASRALHGPS